MRPKSSPNSSGPNPQPLHEVITGDGVELYKRYRCINYTKCLDTAAESNWLQFHCNDCKVYVEQPPEEAEKISTDAHAAMVKLLQLK